ncbi:helix-turn-helix transcriptional regulator [Vibrio sp. CAU 1672]|uniref:helix-turn-helix transcriptional regulator n=1 Tax=Vibrio sp. CAU 1672 TaxID=3032594 RepID=UPI0023DB1FCF|nr:helix-turn-helix transcriptional regulator [Vibrio sp. CAU 1672]MDF2152569.1 helix-turn-helix transcriptional regulator [Vibrio sp. CAU 1672]
MAIFELPPSGMLPSNLLEEIAQKELNKLGLEHAVFMVLDRTQKPVFDFNFGFTQKQLQVYEAYQHHDVYLNEYMNTRLFGQLSHIQQLVPINNINDEVFLDILVPTLQLRQGYSGLYPLMHRHMMLLSCHSFRPLTPNQFQQLTLVWRLLIDWSNSWIAQRQLMLSWSHFRNPPTDVRTHSQNLTSAENQILHLLARGYSGSEIAQLRQVSKETIRSQIKQLLRKTGCKHQNQLISHYYQNHLLIPTDDMA